MSEWATHQNELARKVVDVINDRLYRHAAGTDESSISERELGLIADALYDTITGLVPWDVADMIAQIRKELA